MKYEAVYVDDFVAGNDKHNYEFIYPNNDLGSRWYIIY
jgi:hypothetical protein